MNTLIRGHALHVAAALSLLLAPAMSAAQPARPRRVDGCDVGATRTLATSVEPLWLGRASIGVGPVGALAVWFEGEQGRVLPLDASLAPAADAVPQPLAITGSAIEGVFPLGTGFVVITEAVCRGSGGCYLLYATNASGELVGPPSRLTVGTLRASTVRAAEDGSLVAMLVVPTSWDEPIHVVEIRPGEAGPVLWVRDVSIPPRPTPTDGGPDGHRYAFVVDAAGWGLAGPLAGAAGEAALARAGGARALLPHALPPMTQVALYFEGNTLRYAVGYGDGSRGEGYFGGALDEDGELHPDARQHPRAEGLPSALHGDAGARLECDSTDGRLRLRRTHGLHGAWVPGTPIELARVQPVPATEARACATATRARRHLALWSESARTGQVLRLVTVDCSAAGD